MSKNRGVLRIYADASSGLLLGSEMFMPRGEHMAHLLAWAIAQNLTVLDVLKMPFYHPTIEEGVRTALQDAFKKLSNDSLRVNQALCNSVGAIELNK
jgi:dihydrolipoamide dehydrogenase